MNLPADAQISQLYEIFRTPPHVREHCKKVAEAAVKIGKAFQKKGIPVHIEFLRTAALLHDFVRVVDFRVFEPEKMSSSKEDVEIWKKLREKYKGFHHADAAFQILNEKGFPELASLIQKHKFLQIEKGFNTWEEKILFYADKRIKHHTVVTLRERLEDGRRRNAPEADEIQTQKLDQKVFALEKEIADSVGLSAQELL